jgi:hypothetical protein
MTNKYVPANTLRDSEFSNVYTVEKLTRFIDLLAMQGAGSANGSSKKNRTVNK